MEEQPLHRIGIEEKVRAHAVNVQHVRNGYLVVQIDGIEAR